ncbi:MAG: sporulation transcriptional regulator SpoIIID [Clostridia bacterium]|jgi:putative DeoR family transcriptional regulator (stage III sporulation protein D)|nr:sporulation transcriptional regulator SpoIIID [Clostridia bacterium]
MKPFVLVTTTHTDVTVRLRKINPALYNEVRAVLEKNKEERHIRGGIATKEKYLNKVSK